MKVTLNGERAALRDGASVADAVTAAGVDGDRRGIAVAVAGEVVPREDWKAHELREGDEIEVVHAIQGG